MDEALFRRLKELNEDFRQFMGRDVGTFFCPILHKDEAVEICKGHVLPQSTNGSGPWVPQRKDVDNTFGKLCEANLNTVQARNKADVDFLCEKKLSQATKPKIVIKGKEVEHYRTNGIRRVDTHTPLIVEVNGREVANFNVKIDTTVASTVNSNNFEIRLGKDFSPEVWATALKAAHLTMFKLMGYKHVFSPSGTLLGDVLRELFLQASLKGTNTRELLQRSFKENEYLVWPIATSRRIESSINSKRFWICLQSSGTPFALGVLVVIGRDAFCVVTPCDQSIDTYFSFLKTPPVSVAVKEVLFNNDDPSNSHWGINEEEPTRIPILSSIPSV
ncbi:MAG: hypothetical protein KF752_10400 [Pirellulaceae bacterium]|nr:hypothetical protein [Pirellulaceae bacterium]